MPPAAPGWQTSAPTSRGCGQDSPSLAVALAAGKVVPEIAHTERWPYELLGVGFALLGIACIGYGYRRERDIDEALNRGEFAPIARGSSLLLTAGGVSLGLLTFVLIIVRA